MINDKITTECNLNPKHLLFALEYLKDLNGSQAAIRAGYAKSSARITSSKLLTNTNILSFISDRIKERAKTLHLDSTFVLQNLKDVAQNCLTRKKKIIFFEGKEVETKKLEYEDVTAGLKALGMLGKYLKLFSDKEEIDKEKVTVQIVYGHISDEELYKRIDEAGVKLG